MTLRMSFSAAAWRRHGDGTATLYAGLGDAAAGSLVVPDPFAALEGDTDNTVKPQAA